MIVLKPYHDFKDTRKKLPIPMQVYVDNLIIAVVNIMTHLIELDAPNQEIEISISPNQKIRFIFVGENAKYYVMFTFI